MSAPKRHTPKRDTAPAACAAPEAQQAGYVMAEASIHRHFMQLIIETHLVGWRRPRRFLFLMLEQFEQEWGRTLDRLRERFCFDPQEDRWLDEARRPKTEAQHEAFHSAWRAYLMRERVLRTAVEYGQANPAGPEVDLERYAAVAINTVLGAMIEADVAGIGAAVLGLPRGGVTEGMRDLAILRLTGIVASHLRLEPGKQLAYWLSQDGDSAQQRLLKELPDAVAKAWLERAGGMAADELVHKSEAGVWRMLARPVIRKTDPETGKRKTTGRREVPWDTATCTAPLAPSAEEQFMLREEAGAVLKEARLSRQELEVFKLTALGFKQREIAGQLGISVKTVGVVKWRADGKLSRARAELDRAAD